MATIENIALESAAGSGKTRALTRQFLHLFLDDARIGLETIYGITFTNEATLEMKKRIVRYLDLVIAGDARDDGERTILDEFRARFPDAAERAKRRKKYLLHNLSDLNISTFHSLFASFLSSIPFAAGVLPDYEIIEETEEDLLFDRVLDRFLEEVPLEPQPLRRTLDELTEGEETPVKTLLTATYKNALPWFGYLTDLIDRKESIDRDVERLRGEFGSDLKRLKDFIGTNDDAGMTKTTGTMNRHLVSYLERIGEYLETADLETLDRILKAGFTGAGYVQAFREKLGDRTAAFDTITERLTRCRHHYFTALSDQKLAARLLPVFDLARRFRAEKQKRNLLGFDDIERSAHDALTRTIETGYLYFKIGARVDHLLIDEFQDTSFLQLEILDPIIAEILSVSPREKSLFYVGDPLQAIFRWRGGAAELFTILARRHAGKIRHDRLAVNYRSKQEIVECVNAVIQRGDGERPDQARPGNAGGWVKMEKLGEFRDKGEAEETAINRVSALVRELQGEFNYRYSDIAVLVRRNAFGAAVARALARAGIPCLSKSRADILQSDDVRLIVSLLEFLDDPENDFALFTVLVSSLFSMKEETVRFLKARGPTIYRALGRLHPDWPATAQLKSLLDLVFFSNPYELLFRVYQTLGLPVSYALATLLDAAAEYSKKGFSSLGAFLDWLETAGPSIDIKEAHPEGVEVLTVHKAKGLEFEVVILAETFHDSRLGENPNLIFSYGADRVKPESVWWRAFGKYETGLVDAETARLEKDELNLLYVAMTRAKSGLYILGAVKKEPMGFWYQTLSKQLGGTEYATGDIKPHPPHGGERPATAEPYRAGVEKGTIARDQGGQPPDIVPAAGSERQLFSPTEKEVAIVAPARSKGMEFGDCVHRALARVEFLDGADPESTALQIVEFMKDRFGRTPDDLDALDDKLAPLLRETLSDPDLRFIFYRDGIEKKCKNELPVYFALDRRDVSVHIDRLVAEPDRTVVVDYKTGAAKPEYKEQLRVYVKGVAAMYPGKKVEAMLVYLEAERGKKIVRII